jgi:hypothetical protein
MIEGHDYAIYSHGPSGRARMCAFSALITAFLTPVIQQGDLVLRRRYWRDDRDIVKVALFFGGPGTFRGCLSTQPRGARWRP